MCPSVQSNTVYNNQDMEATCVSISWWMDKEYVYVWYYLAMKKNEIMPFAATWMDLAIIKLSQVSQTEKDEGHMISLICGT